MSSHSTGGKQSGDRPAGFRLAKFRRGGRGEQEAPRAAAAVAKQGVAAPGEGMAVAVPVLGVLVFSAEVRALAAKAKCGVYSAAVAVLLRLLRQARGWTEVELASRSGVKRQSIHAWECAKQLPRLDRLRLVTGAFDLSAGRLPDAAEEIAGRILQF